MTRKAYIILTHKYIPKSNGTKKDTKKRVKKTNAITKEWEVIEECEFVDKVKNRHLTDATVIINVTDKILQKNRVKEATYEKYIEHITSTYESKYADFLKKVEEQGL